MADVRSKNLYELLGNDPELDSDREPSPPPKVVEKPAPRLGKREAPKEAPTAPRGGGAGARGNRGGRVTGNEAAFRDRQAGSYNNRNRPIDEQKEAQRRGVKAREDRGARVRNDRHPRSGETDTHKRIDQGWGATRGESRWNDEKAGEAIAENDENEPQTPNEPAEEEKEPQEKTKSYAEYLAEKAENKREDLGVKAARPPNEGVKIDKKWANAKELKRDEEEEGYFKGLKEEKTKRERQRKEKTYLDVDMRFVEPPRSRENGPRGRGRGGRGRGEFRGNGPRGGGRGAPTPTVDEKNFPSLGSK